LKKRTKKLFPLAYAAGEHRTNNQKFFASFFQKRRVFLLSLVLFGFLATALMLAWWGAAGIGNLIWRALPALPAALAVHFTQLALSGLAWRCQIVAPVAAWIVIRARWVREALNTAIPLGGLGGAVGSARLLARDAHLSTAAATAALTADITVETLAQAPYLAAALATVAVLAPGHFSLARAALAILPVALGTIAFVIAQRAGLMRLVERAARRLGFGEAMAGLHDSLMALHHRPAAVLRALALHGLSWSLGGAEVWVILHAIAVPVSPGAAFAIEGLGMAARSLGFALPAGLAAQEAGFVLACAVFGISAQEGLALSMVKRVREVLVAAFGILVWRIKTRQA
jgi:uncharacterized membrane protein YbhN (UPF0104 family)